MQGYQIEISNIKEKLLKIEQEINNIESTLLKLIKPMFFGKSEYFKRKDQFEKSIIDKNNEKSILTFRLNKIIEDIKFNRIINCPKCKGNGWRVSEYFTNTRMIVLSNYKGVTYNSDDLSLDGKRDDFSQTTVSYEKEDCKFCKAEGIAYAYFEDLGKKCDICNGKSFIENESKIKQDIGIKINKSVVECKKCNGFGIRKYKFISIRTLAYYDDLTVIGEDWKEETKKIYLKKEEAEIKRMEINEPRDSFLLLSKSRFDSSC